MKDIFKEALKTISKARTFIFIALILYFFAAVAGWVYGDSLNFLEDQIRELARQFAGKSALVFIAKVFARNLIATYIVMCLFPLFGLVPCCATVFNGLLVGWLAIRFSGVGGPNFFLSLIPHGIFEWPAMMIGWGVGIWRGFGYRFAKEESSYFKRWVMANEVYFTVIVPLLIVAAIIEGRFHISKEFF
jgi:uncharacterized membrane protein SpoIIM required for sporulation